jgi:hypothetical protein
VLQAEDETVNAASRNPFYFEYKTKLLKALRGENAEFLNVKGSGTCNNRFL